MPVRVLTFVAALAVAGPALPSTRAITASVTRYVADYQRAFIALVADESTRQRVVHLSRVTASRTTDGELFSVFLDDEDVWMSVHDVQRVDGEAVPPQADVRALLRSQSIRTIGPWLAAANARYNIGHVSRNFNEPTLALSLFTPARVHDLRITRDAVDASAPGGTLVTLKVRGRDGFTLVRSVEGAVTMTGAVVVEPDTGRIHRSTVAFSDHAEDATLETSYAFDAHVALWVPVTFVEHYVARATGEETTVESDLTNYRRFETAGRLVP